MMRFPLRTAWAGQGGRSRPTRSRLAWLPLLLIGACLYWTTALTLGEMSFELLTVSDEDLDLVSSSQRHRQEGREERIYVRLIAPDGEETGCGSASHDVSAVHVPTDPTGRTAY